MYAKNPTGFSGGHVKCILLPIILLILAPLTIASELNYYNVEYQVNTNVKTTIEFEFTDSKDLTDFNIDLPSDVKTINLLIEDEKRGKDITKAKKVRYSYTTQKYLESTNNFLTNFKLPYSADQVEITLKLPIETSLKDIIEESVFPYPNQVTSDGQRIIIQWSKANADTQENFSFFVIFKEKTNLIPYILIILILVLVAILILFLKKKPKKIQPPKKTQKQQNIEFHLKEDEKQVIRVLKRKNGQCTQATLRVITDLSKAKLSRILKELEERKVVHREAKGNKKVVTLKKAAWNILEQDKD